MPKEKAEKSLCMSGLRHAEYYGMQEVFDGLYAKSSKNETFTNLMNIILKRENILLAYRNIKSNDGSKTPGTDGVTFDDIGKLMPDEGKVEWAKNVRVGYLDQHTVLEKGMTIREVLKSAFSFLFEMEEKMNQICDHMGEASGEEMNSMMEELGTIQDLLMAHDFYIIDSKEEEVARAIFACETPVISAVGHETDVTVADYVADLRAPTPSAAAELAVFDYARFAADLEARKRKLSREMGFFLDQVKGRLRQDELKIRLYHPQHVIREKRQRLADQEERLERIMDARTGENRSRLQSREERLSRAMDRRMENDKKRLAEASGRLWGLSPLRKLSQGFGYIEDQEGKRLGSVKQAPPGSGITVQVADGTLSALVTERNEESGWQNWIKTEQT